MYICLNCNILFNLIQHNKFIMTIYKGFKWKWQKPNKLNNHRCLGHLMACCTAGGYIWKFVIDIRWKYPAVEIYRYYADFSFVSSLTGSFRFQWVPTALWILFWNILMTEKFSRTNVTILKWFANFVYNCILHILLIKLWNSY